MDFPSTLARALVQTVGLILCLLAFPLLPKVLSLETQSQVVGSSGAITYADSTWQILFEYGAESGVLQPPWDYVGPQGSGDHSGSEVTVDTARYRTGTKSCKFYQIDPSDNVDGERSDAQRRVELRYAHTKKECYISWWAYFPSGVNWETPYTGTPSLGGFQTHWGTTEKSWKHYTAGRFDLTPSKYFYFMYEWGGYSWDTGAEAQEETWNTNYKMSDFLNQWVHFQVYIKFANNSQGAVSAWFNNNLVANKTGLNSDPTGYSRFATDNCFFPLANDAPFPHICIEQYGSTTTPNNAYWYWVDDIVASDTKVPEDYGVTEP